MVIWLAIETTVDKNFNGTFSVVIKHYTSKGYELQYPVVEDGVTWETDRQGSPGKLTFKVYPDSSGNLSFQEGDGVIFYYQKGSEPLTDIFNGYVFTKKRNKNKWIEVTAYDQLRYLKNKATYTFTNKKASDITKMIATDFKLPIGTIEDTAYVIGSRVEDDQSLFDIVQNALDLTLVSSNEKYVLFADKGKIHLRNIKNMKTDILINESTAEDFDYSSSIDEETYNEIELYYDNDKTNKREYYHAVDPTNVNKWGRLRLTESVKNPSNAGDRAKQMLKLYNQKTRKLDAKGVFGDCRCRAGSSVIVHLALGDIVTANYMVVEKAKHTFKKDMYRMDLTLDGIKEFA